MTKLIQLENLVESWPGLLKGVSLLRFGLKGNYLCKPEVVAKIFKLSKSLI